MKGINKVIIVGTLGRDPEVRQVMAELKIVSTVGLLVSAVKTGRVVQ